MRKFLHHDVPVDDHADYTEAGDPYWGPTDEPTELAGHVDEADWMLAELTAPDPWRASIEGPDRPAPF